MSSSRFGFPTPSSLPSVSPSPSPSPCACTTPLFFRTADGGFAAASDDAVIACALALTQARLSQPEAYLSSPESVSSHLCLRLGNRPHEVFGVLLFDVQGGLLECVELFRGTLTQTSVYPREVVKLALSWNCAGLVLFHNHPSGSVQPSRADENLTRILKEALALVDVRVLDHVIVSGDRSFSMAQNGLV